MKFYSPKKGFTLVELLVSMSIVATMAAISISAYPSFSEQISATSETYKSLAFFKETQSFGVASVSKPKTKVVYGFAVEKGNPTISRFEIENPANAMVSTYITSLSSVSASATTTIKDRFEISEIEGVINNSTTTLDRFYAFYRRPNPESKIVGFNSNNNSILLPTAAESFDKVIITVQSKKNSKFFKKIVILQTGQMYVSDW